MTADQSGNANLNSDAPTLPERDRQLLQHFLAAIAYRTQKALRGAPAGYADFPPGHEVRTPGEILQHMTELMTNVRDFFTVSSTARPAVAEADHARPFADEVQRFHDVLQSVGALIAAGTAPSDITTEQLLQGPFSDVMTHVGQLAILRRLAQSPVASENFIYADIRHDRLGVDQAAPVRPDVSWKPFNRTAVAPVSGDVNAGRSDGEDRR